MGFLGLMLIFWTGCALALTMGPIIGLYLWVLIDTMNPHLLLWKANWNYSFYIAITTMIAWLVSKEKKTPETNPFAIFVIIMVGFLIIAELNTLHPSSYSHTDKAIKMLACVYVAALLINSRIRMHGMVIVLVAAMGFYMFKGGLFGVLTGGGLQDLGPRASMIGDSNHMALAMNTMIPLAWFLYQYSSHRIFRYAMLATTLLGVLAVLMTFSRGGLLALLCLGGYMFLRSRQKIAILAGGLVALVIASFILPQTWFNRMDELNEGEQVGTFQTRLAGWENAFNVAVGNPVTGGGLRTFYQHNISKRYFSGYRISQMSKFKAWAGHSVYFEMLAGIGFIGFFFFLFIVYRAMARASRAAQMARDHEDMKWAIDLSSMLRTSLVAFLVGGAAVSMEWWIGFWMVLMLNSNLLSVVEREIAVKEGNIGKKKRSWNLGAPNTETAGAGKPQPA